MRTYRSTRAFTLIELLLVLVILATLAAIVTPKFANRSKQAKVTQVKTQIENFKTAIATFEIDVGRYPTTSEGLEALVKEPTNAEGWQSAYLDGGVPLDPWGNEYIYKIPGSYNEDGYDLYSTGPDGKTGGDDDIKNWLDDDERSD
ncbi:type II secretion system major pseudopilin GspG [Planctomycetota bacterium]